MKKVFFLATALYGSLAFANGDYPLVVSRAHGTLQCTINSVAKSHDCLIHIVGQNELSITMSEVKNSNQEVIGYKGQDMVVESAKNYSLNVCAKTDKTIKSVALIMDDKVNDTTPFMAGAAAVKTSVLQAATLAPISINKADPAAIKVELTFVAYADPNSHLIQRGNSERLSEFLVDEITPYLMSLR